MISLTKIYIGVKFMCQKIEKAYAKINLYLDIEKKREDGFHDLFTIMQIVDLCDDVIISLNNTNKITLKMKDSPVDVSMEKNIAYIAAQKFYENLDFEATGRADIEIIKRIPVAAGLAGGSADAAAVLRGLNYLYDNPYTVDELCEIGASLGSDVPFNIVGGVQICRAKGECMQPTSGIQNHSILIACGDEKLSTAEQYKKLDSLYNNFIDYPIKEQFYIVNSGFTSEQYTQAFEAMYNVFESLYEENEKFRKIKEIMYNNSAKVAMLSGSGPSVFGVFNDRFDAENAKEFLAKEGIKSYLCNPISNTY
jgi:4-diphosphocytidyl-2-C-methyl-D-erythritol kinase